jgi:malic enzyme
VDKGRLAQGGLYPRMDKIRVASKQVSVAVIRQAQKEGVATEKLPEDLEGYLEARMWRPEFLPIRKARGG